MNPVEEHLRICREHFDAGQYRELVVTARPLLSQFRALGNKHLEERAAFLILFGRAQCQMEEFEDAAESFQDALELIGGSDASSPLVLEINLEIAVLAMKRQSLDPECKSTIDVEGQLKGLVKKLKANPEKYTRLLIKSLSHLGRYCVNKLEPDLINAAHHLRQALNLSQKNFGKSDRSSYYPLVGLSVLHQAEGKPILSAAMAREAAELIYPGITAQETEDSPIYHALLVEPLMFRAQALSAQGLHSKALVPARQAYFQALGGLGDEHSLFRKALSVRASVLRNNFELDIAAEDYRQLFDLCMVDLRKKNPNEPEKDLKESSVLIGPLCDLASTLARSGEKEQAQKFFEQALHILEVKVDALPTEETESTKGKRLQWASDSTCYQEKALLDNLSHCYLMQGKLDDTLRLIPASLRADYTCRVDRITQVFDVLSQAQNKNIEKLDHEDAIGLANALTVIIQAEMALIRGLKSRTTPGA